MWQRLPPGDPARGPQRNARIITVASVVGFWLIATAWRPWLLFARAGFSADFYDEQARAFLRGRLHVDPAVAGIEGFVIDDRTYLYFGPLLAVVRMPLAITGSWSAGRLALLSTLLALLVACTWAYRLYLAALQMAGNRGADGRDRWRVVLWMGAIGGSPLLALSGWISVYHETELWACAFAVIGATQMLRLLERPDMATAWSAGAATIAAVLTRASVGIGVSVALIAVGVIVARNQRRTGEHRGVSAPVLTVFGAAVTGVAVHMAVNVARFGSALSLPAERQVLTLVDADRAAWFAGNDGSFFSLRFLPTTLLHYLRPDTVRFERLVPGVRFGPPADDIGRYPMESITPASSLTAAAPVLLVLALVGIVWLARERRWSWLVVTSGLAVGAVPTLLIGFIANRYLVDMLPALAVPAAVGAAVATRPRAVGPALARTLIVIAVGWSAWVNASLGTWILGLKSPGFTELRYRVDGAVFPGPSPGLVERADPAVPRDGIVAIDRDTDGSCAGVYVAEQGRWVALERPHGVRQISGETTADPEGALVRTDRWSIEVADGGDQLVLVVEGEQRAALPAAGLGPGSIVYVVADPVIPELSVRTSAGTVLFDPSVPQRDETLTSDVLALDTGDRPTLCDLLRDRL